MSFFVHSFLSALVMICSLDPQVYFVAWTSLKVSAIATLVAATIGVPLGVLIALKRFIGKRVVVLILNTSMALPTVVVGLFFYGLLSRRGPLGELGWLFTPQGIASGLSVLALPLVVNLTLAAIQGLDPRLVLTCRSLGATAWQQTLMVVREARFAVTAAVVVAFGRVISEVGIAMMLGGNIKGFTRTMTTAIALETSKGEFEFALALGIFLLSVAFLVNALLFMIQRSRV